MDFVVIESVLYCFVTKPLVYNVYSLELNLEFW